ncbi:hypothetical protein LJC63_07690 [Ruminococcaceae bacterium OttesenSCG-928-L11]|nr:hypothetical protein [Ruminococcaceae bacterium OttesenSCG-928-L11]
MATRLGQLTGLPVVHLDSLFWNPGWVQTPSALMAEKVHAAADQPAWVIDGNYSSTRDYRLERADTVIYLDFNHYTCLFRAFKRFFKNYGRTRSDLGEGCPEQMDWVFIKWIWRFPKRSRGDILGWLAAAQPSKQIIHLKGNKAVRDFLSQVQSQYSNTPESTKNLYS